MSVSHETHTETVEELEARIDRLERELDDAEAEIENLQRDLEREEQARDEDLNRLETANANLEEGAHEFRRLAERADYILRDLAHRATIGEPQAIAAETELRAFLKAVAEAA